MEAGCVNHGGTLMSRSTLHVSTCLTSQSHGTFFTSCQVEGKNAGYNSGPCLLVG